MHLKARLVEAISHDGKNVLNEGKKILLVKWLGNVWIASNILKKVVQDLQTLRNKRCEN